MLIAVLVGFAVLVFGIAMIVYLLARGSKSAAISEDDFDAVYDEVVAAELPDSDRDEAWRSFEAWRMADEEERRSWEEPSDE